MNRDGKGMENDGIASLPAERQSRVDGGQARPVAVGRNELSVGVGLGVLAMGSNHAVDGPQRYEQHQVVGFQPPQRQPSQKGGTSSRLRERSDRSSAPLLRLGDRAAPVNPAATGERTNWRRDAHEGAHGVKDQASCHGPTAAPCDSKAGVDYSAVAARRQSIPWTSSEVRLLAQAVRVYGLDLTQIARMVTTRTAEECESFLMKTGTRMEELHEKFAS